MIGYLLQIDPATLATVVAGLGSAAGALGGKWFGHRSAVRKIEAGAIDRVSGALGRTVAALERRCDGLERELTDSHADRAALHGELEALRARVRQDERERATLSDRFAHLLDHVRVLRAILSAHSISHPPGPEFLEDGVA